MSQYYFDVQVNKIGEQAAQFVKVINPNKILQEEINSWSDILE
jgi:hypothetical protein